MPLINLEFDNKKLSTEEVERLSIAITDIVSRVTGIADVFVYANSADIKVQIAPVEIFVRLSRKLATDPDELLQRIKNGIQEWKHESHFSHPINLTVIPMDWVIEIAI